MHPDQHLQAYEHSSRFGVAIVLLAFHVLSMLLIFALRTLLHAKIQK